jgi:hypothetical protein
MNLSIKSLFAFIGGFVYIAAKDKSKMNGYPSDCMKDSMIKISNHSDTNPGTKPKSILAGLKYKYLMKR